MDLSYIFDDDYVKEHGEIPQYIPVYKVKFSKIFKDYNFIADNDIDSMIVYMRYDLAGKRHKWRKSCLQYKRGGRKLK